MEVAEAVVVVPGEEAVVAEDAAAEAAAESAEESAEEAAEEAVASRKTIAALSTSIRIRYARHVEVRPPQPPGSQSSISTPSPESMADSKAGVLPSIAEAPPSLLPPLPPPPPPPPLPPPPDVTA